MNNIELAFERPLLLLLLIPVLAVILLPFFLLPKHRRKGVKRILPLVLHCVMALLLCMILAGFTIIKVSDEQSVLLLVDLSYSTQRVKDEIKARTEELLSIIDETTPVGVVAFGKEQAYLLDLESTDRQADLSTAVGEATDLESALDYALSLAPEDRAYRVILLSDGKQNAGQAEDAAYRLAESGVRVDALYFDSTLKGVPEMQISSFSAPEGLWKGEEFTLSCEIKSNVSSQAQILLYEGEQLLSERTVDIKEGATPLLFELTALEGGLREYRLEIVAPYGKDSLEQNNAAVTFLKVTDKQKMLILAERLSEGAALTTLLGEEFEFTVKKIHEAPRTITDLCDYDGVILLNTDYYSLPAAFTRIIGEYVSVYGRSLFLAGGSQTFMFGNMEDTVLEEMSPLEFKFEESPEGATVAMMLVLDCSRSMKGEYLALAKQGAIKSLEALNPNDRAGVISFHSEETLECPLILADDEGIDKLTHVISGLETGSGTFYTNALTLATEELLKCDADVKHILFLSDGQPNDGGYYSAVIDANEQGITVSTVGLYYASSVLDYMAFYGKGRYYYVTSSDDLPEIMLSEAEQARVNPTIKGQIKAVAKRQSSLTENLDLTTLPPLSGYLGTTAKDTAEVYLSTDKGHPLFAVAEYGLGKVSCLTTDLNAIWTEGWFADPVASGLIRDMISFTRPKISKDTTLIYKTEQSGSDVLLRVNSVGTSFENTLTVLLESRSGEILEYSLPLKARGLYEGVLQADPNTVYKMTLIEKNAAGTELDRVEGALASGWCGEYDAFAPGGQALLATICNLTGGSLLQEAKQGADIVLAPLKTPRDLTAPFALLCGLLFLIDVAVRRLRLKDIKEHFYEWQALWQAKKNK